METLHNQELVATILEDNVASELTTIQDFLRWTYSTFNRSDIYYGQGHDNAWDESLQLVLARFIQQQTHSFRKRNFSTISFKSYRTTCACRLFNE